MDYTTLLDPCQIASITCAARFLRQMRPTYLGSAEELGQTGWASTQGPSDLAAGLPGEGTGTLALDGLANHIKLFSFGLVF